LTRRGKIAEAAVLVRELADATEDPKASAELRDQAGQLEALAVVNQHIVLYNDAVALSNEGKRVEAERRRARVHEPQTVPRS
jgi:hypothetical protein